MRILQINSVCGIRSTGRITADLYKLLAEQGHECRIAYGRNITSGSAETIRIGTRFNPYLHALYSRITDRTAFASKLATKKLIEEIKSYNPDIIHLHNLHGYYINIELLFDYLRVAKKPVIWTIHDCWSFTGHCCHFDYIGCDKWKMGCYACAQKKIYPASLLFDNSKNNYLKKKELITGCENITIVAPSNWLAGMARESYLSRFTIVTIPNGIDLDLFKMTDSDLRRQYGLEDKKMVLGAASGFSESKGIKYMILLSEMLPKNYKLVLVGVNKKQNRYFPDTILTLPQTDSMEELARFYTAADVFVNPTLQETQGLTNIEALACGTGVVTFDSGGCKECVTSECGYAVKRGDISGLLEAVKKACDTPFDRSACRNRAMAYDKSKLYMEYIRLYERVLS